MRDIFWDEDVRRREEEYRIDQGSSTAIITVFDGRRKKFDLKLSYHGTEFQIKVWKALEKIPYGETCTYKDIAESVGIPKGCRAVGMANNRNPIVIVVPCHRVIGMNGSLTGYAGGLEMKEYLLDLEKSNQKLKERY